MRSIALPSSRTDRRQCLFATFQLISTTYRSHGATKGNYDQSISPPFYFLLPPFSCRSCHPVVTDANNDQVKLFDDTHMQKLNSEKKVQATRSGRKHRLPSSAKASSQLIDEESPWKTLHQNYLQVAVSTNAGLWSFAPQGVSKFGHLADGLLDLILIEPTGRKEFLRYVKRNGNSKNQVSKSDGTANSVHLLIPVSAQYDFPFTKLIKIKEIEIELKLNSDSLLHEKLDSDNDDDTAASADSSNEDPSTRPTATSSRQSDGHGRPPCSDGRAQKPPKSVLRPSATIDVPAHSPESESGSTPVDERTTSPAPLAAEYLSNIEVTSRQSVPTATIDRR